MQTTNIILCPICQSPLDIKAYTWQCSAVNSKNGKAHSFDVAKQGYINLLPVQNKKTKTPGDSAESVLARQSFLNDGFYQPLKQVIQQLINKYSAHTSNARKQQTGDQHAGKQQLWLDIGCGEGYYTQICQHLTYPTSTIAVDISKSAVLTLAKDFKQKRLLWNQQDSFKDYQQQANAEQQNNCLPQSNCSPMVASASNLPITSATIDIVTSIFSPIIVDEITRVLKEDGYLLIAKPAKGHLASIRQALFDEVREHDSDKFLVELEDKGFTLIETQEITAALALNQMQLKNLLTMTPYSYKAKKENREVLIAKAAGTKIETEAKFIVYLLQPKNKTQENHKLKTSV